MKTSTRTVPPGRPKTSALTRREQLRLAKRAQRERERAAGTVSVPIRLPRAEAERLRVALDQPDFARRLAALVDDEVVEVAAYENLAGLCWNRRSRYVAAEEAFRLYERNWRFVDTRRMTVAERALIERLVQRFGNGVLHV